VIESKEYMAARAIIDSPVIVFIFGCWPNWVTRYVCWKAKRKHRLTLDLMTRKKLLEGIEL
jgi:hypothetical protein